MEKFSALYIRDNCKLSAEAYDKTIFNNFYYGTLIMTTIDDFLNNINDPKVSSFESGMELLHEDGLCSQLKEHIDNDGNNIIHLIIEALVCKLRYLYSPFQHLSTVYNTPEEQCKICVSSCLDVLNKLFLIGIKPILNHQNFHPLERLRKAFINFCNIDAILQEYLPAFEANGQLCSGRKYVYSLSFFRSSKKPHKACPVPDAFPYLDSEDKGSKLTLHERLAVYEQYLRYTGKTGGAINLVVANLGFIISDLPKSNPNHKPVFITIPIQFQNYLTYAEKSTKGTHSEDGLCDILNSEYYLTDLKAYLKYYYLNHKIYSLVLDIHSSAEICKTCQGKLHELQGLHQDGFLNKISTFLKDIVYLPRRLRLTLRASGIRDPGFIGEDKMDIMPPTFCETPPMDIKQHPQQVLFHLPPSWNKYYSTGFFLDSSIEKLKSYKSELREQFHNAFPLQSETLTSEEKQKAKQKFHSLAMSTHPNTHFKFFEQTAFCNTGGQAASIRSNVSNEPTQIEWHEELINMVHKGLIV